MGVWRVIWAHVCFAGVPMSLCQNYNIIGGRCDGRLADYFIICERENVKKRDAIEGEFQFNWPIARTG